jgi:hypothetical protein
MRENGWTSGLPHKRFISSDSREGVKNLNGFECKKNLIKSVITVRAAMPLAGVVASF